MLNTVETEKMIIKKLFQDITAVRVDRQQYPWSYMLEGIIMSLVLQSDGMRVIQYTK